MNRKMWGGRFRGRTSRTVEQFTHSLSFDRRLARYDLLGSIAHARMLGNRGIISRRDSQLLVRSLKSLLNGERRGRLNLDASSEDIHTAIQILLQRKAGKAAEKLHTARSRNDQVVTSLRLYCKEKLCELDRSVKLLQRSILKEAQRVHRLILPGYTHLRHAQPLLASHLLLSYLHLLQRDRERMTAALARADELPLGSGALTGTGLPIDRISVARELGFSRISENSVDAVSSRDFALETLCALSLLSMHLSRIAEDLLLFSTEEFGFLRFHERLLTGSSMMPQKQNPDFLELVRAGASMVTGCLTSLLGLMKGLPTGYQRDLQCDKESLFQAFDRMEGMLSVMTEGFSGILWNPQRINLQLKNDSLYATDLAEYLVTKGVPFAQAHRAVGQLLSHAQRLGKGLRFLPLATFWRFSPSFGPDVVRLLDPASSVRWKKSTGSTQPRGVEKAIRRWRLRLA